MLFFLGIIILIIIILILLMIEEDLRAFGVFAVIFLVMLVGAVTTITIENDSSLHTYVIKQYQKGNYTKTITITDDKIDTLYTINKYSNN